jgi:hypothetical protein
MGDHIRVYSAPVAAAHVHSKASLVSVYAV